MRRQAGDVIVTNPRTGATVRYAPSQGSTAKYVIRCKHGKAVQDRTRRDAVWASRHPADFCDDCDREGFV